MRTLAPALLALGACSLPVEEAHEAHDVWHMADTSRVEISLDAGHVEIHAGSSTVVEVRSRWTGEAAPEVETSRVGGALVVTGACATADCRTDIVLTMPAAAPVEVFTGAGNVVVDGLVGDVFADTGRGEVQLFDLSGNVDVTTRRGDVYATNVMGPALDAVAVSGAVHLSR